MLMTALNVAFDRVVVACPGVVVGMFEIVIKNANTPTDRIINATTALIIWYALRSIFFL
jgi:hypothetical protein